MLKESINNSNNETDTLKINHLFYNQTKTLVSVSTNRGYRIYDSNTFTLLTSNRDNIGDIDICKILYSSQLIFFKGSKRNPQYNSKQLVIWDDLRNKQIASITFKEDIENFGLTEKVLYVKCLKGLMVFELHTLKYCTTFEKTSPFLIFSCTDIDLYSSYIAYAELHLKIIKVQMISLHPNTSAITSIKTKVINTIFNNIKTIKFVDQYLIISNYYGNKVHLYSIKDFELRYCFFLGYYSYELSNFSIDKTAKYFMLSTNNKYIKMFKLKNSSDVTCKCDSYDDKDIDVDRKRKLYFYWNKIFGVISEIHCRFRFNSQVLTLAAFNMSLKDRIILVESNGKMFVIVFNRKSRSEINALQIKTWL